MQTTFKEQMEAIKTDIDNYDRAIRACSDDTPLIKQSLVEHRKRLNDTYSSIAALNLHEKSECNWPTCGCQHTAIPSGCKAKEIIICVTNQTEREQKLLEFVGKNYTCQEIAGQLMWRMNTKMAPGMVLYTTENLIKDIHGRKLLSAEVTTHLPNFENKFTPQELSFIKDAINAYWHESHHALVERGHRQELGDLERASLEFIKKESKRLMEKIEQ